jgi:hypothetical protein
VQLLHAGPAVEQPRQLVVPGVVREELKRIGLADSGAHNPLPGGGQELWDGGSLLFGPDDEPGPDHIEIHHRMVAATLSAPEPVCHDETASVAISVEVENLGPHGGYQGVGGLRLYHADGTELERDLVVQDPPVGHVQTLTVGADVDPEDLFNGDIVVWMDLETYHFNPETPAHNEGTQWEARDFEASYAFGTEGCDASIDLTKSVDVDEAEAGDTVEYTLIAENTGGVAHRRGDHRR